MSETNIEQHPQQPAPAQEAIQLDTKIEFLNQKFYFHDILKASGINKHYIAEDLEYDASINASGGFFYLKQSLYSHKGEYQYALKYYQKLLNYCKMPFAKTDIIRLHQIHNFDLEDTNYFEIVLIFDLGEPDRIDIDNIESQHITKFLKNVCLLLQDLKKFDQIYHGNIYIKNIVLVNNELKLSGFKPIFLENPDYQTWKVELAHKFNHFRSDLYLIGLIWLRFLGANVEEATNLKDNLDTVIANINNILQTLPEDKKMNIVLRLLDLENNPELTLDDVILEFDEFYILENIRSVEQEKKRLAESGVIEDDGDQNQAFAFDDNRTNSVDERFDSIGGAPLKKSDSKDTNPFMRPYKESEKDLHALRGDDGNNHASESKQNQDYLKIDGDFTLQDDDSIMPARLSKDELITIQDVKREHSKSMFDNMNPNDVNKKYESNTIANKMSSEKRLNVENFEEEKTSMRRLKSTEGVFTDSKKEIAETDSRSSAKNHFEPEPKTSVKSRVSNAEEVKPEPVSHKKASVKTSQPKVVPVPDKKKSTPKKEIHVSPPAPKKISNFNKKVKKDKPAVYEVEEEKPSSSQILKEKRAQLQGLKEEVELTPEQRVKIQKAVEKELEKRTQLEMEKQMKQKEEIERKAFEAKLQENIMKDKLEKLTKEKVQKKREELKSELKKKREQTDTMDQEFYQQYLKELEKKEKLQKNRDVSVEKTKGYLHKNEAHVSSTEKDFVTLPSKNESQNLPLKKNQRSLFDNINKRAVKEFQLSSLDQREDLFSYNRDLENKQVPFKRVTQNLEKYQKNDIKKPVSTLDNLFRTLDLEKLKDQAQNNAGQPEEKRNPTDSKSGANKNSFDAIVPHHAEVRRSSPSFGGAPHEDRKSSSPDHHREGNNTQSKSNDRKQSNNLNESNDKIKSPKNSYANPKKSQPVSVNAQRNSSPEKHDKSPSHPADKTQKNVFLDTLFSQADFKNLDPSLLENKIYIKTIDEVKHLINANHNEEAIALLLSAKEKFSNNRKIEVMKMVGALYQKIGQSDKTKQILLEALEYMLPNNNIENKEDIFKSIVMNLVLIAIEANDYHEAVNLLKNQVFNDKAKMPNNYYSLLGDCLTKLRNHKEALAAFEQQLSIWLDKQIGLEMITPLFNLINKIILTHNSLNDQISIAKFYSKMVGVLSNIKHINVSLQLHENDFDNLLENLSLNVLNFASDRQNYNLMNYVMNEIVGKNLLNYVNNMNEEERVQLCDHFVHFCNYLKKLNNYGGFKANFIKYLEYAKGIIKNCDLNTKNLKVNLLILFNRGIFYLQEQNYEKAQKLFDKCLEVYYAFFNEPDKDLYSILYSIGFNLYRQKKFSQSVYFFNKMLDMNCQDPLLKEKATKYLSKVYYRIGEFVKCREILDEFIAKHFEGKSIINYYRYLSLYYLCLFKLKSEEFDSYLENLQDEVVQNQNVEATNYLLVYQNVNNIMNNHHNYKDNEKFLGLLQELAADKNMDKNAKSAKLVNLFSLLHQKYIIEKSDDKSQGNKTIIQSLRDKWLTISENAEMAKDFLLNFLIILVNRLPLYNERMKNHQFRQNVIDDVRSSIDSESINIYISELFKSFASQNTEEADVDSIVQKLQPSPHKGPANVFSANMSDKEVRKVTSEQVLLKSTLQRQDCLCGEEYNTNPEIAGLIEVFLKQIKNMLFLDVTENVEVYYMRFETVLKEKGISTDKYSYIKKLIQYHLLRKKYQKLDRLKFTKMLDELVESNNLCVHDYKLIVVILESFKEIEYLHIFVIYLDTYHPNLASLIFKQVFLDVFEHKYAKIVAALYKKIHAFRFYQLENFPLMHYLESENFISIEKELQFKIFTRLRYDIMNEERMNKVFLKYIDINELQMFYVKYNTYLSIVSAIKQDNVSSLSILRNFYTNLSSSVIKYQIEEIHSKHYVYDFLVLVHLLKFNEDEDLTETIFQILAFIEDRLPQSLYYHFSVLCSSIGNIFFKYNLKEASLKAKSSALDLLNRATDVDTESPKYIIQEDPETHLMQILSFIVVNEIELKDLVQAKVFLDKIDQINNEYALNELTKHLLKAVYFYHAELPKKGRKAMKEADNLFSKMTLKDILHDIYKASMDKVKLLIATKMDSPEEVTNRVRTSQGSIKHLYRSLI